MRFAFIPLVLLSAQSVYPATVSPKADQALRARVTAFYQLLVDGKYRQSQDFVAEDSKDFYFRIKKPEVKSFSILKIDYAPDFHSAVVTVRNKTLVLFPGAGPQFFELDTPSNWKLEKGKWFWYQDQSATRMTPFGPMTFGGSSAGPQGGLPPVFQPPTDISAMRNPVQADRRQIQLDAAHPGAEVITLKNTLAGPVTIKAAPTPGLSVSIAKPDLAQGEATQVTVTPAEGSADRPDKLLLTVLPLNQTIPISINWVK